MENEERWDQQETKSKDRLFIFPFSCKKSDTRKRQTHRGLRETEINTDRHRDGRKQKGTEEKVSKQKEEEEILREFHQKSRRRHLPIPAICIFRRLKERVIFIFTLI